MNLHELARHDVVSTADAAALGLGPRDLDRLADAGAVLRLDRGWYAVRSPNGREAPWVGPTPWETTDRLHRLRTAAACLAYEGRALASHQSSLVLHGGRTWDCDLGTVHLTRLHGDHSRLRPGLAVHAAVPCGMSTVDGLASVPPAVAAIQLGLIRHGERARDPLRMLVAADGLLHDRLATPEDLLAATELFAGSPGIGAVRRRLAFANGAHESVGETRTAHALRLLHYTFDAQVRVEIDDGVAYLDFALRGEQVAVEFDGLAKYGSGPGGTAPETVRRALAKEKVREDGIRRRGWGVARLGWVDLDRLSVIGAKVEAARDQARRLARTA